MQNKCLIFATVAAFLLSGMTAASAQDAPVLSVGGGDFAPDSLYQAPSMLFYPAFSAPRLPSLLRPDLPVSREDRAMAGDFAVHSEVMKSVAAYLRQVPLFEITASGTWKQVMVDWEEYTEQMSGFSGNLQTEPVPAVPVTPVERAMRR